MCKCRMKMTISLQHDDRSEQPDREGENQRDDQRERREDEEENLSHSFSHRD